MGTDAEIGRGGFGPRGPSASGFTRQDYSDNPYGEAAARALLRGLFLLLSSGTRASAVGSVPVRIRVITRPGVDCGGRDDLRRLYE